MNQRMLNEPFRHQLITAILHPARFPAYNTWCSTVIKMTKMSQPHPFFDSAKFRLHPRTKSSLYKLKNVTNRLRFDIDTEYAASSGYPPEPQPYRDKGA